LRRPGRAAKIGGINWGWMGLGMRRRDSEVAVTREFDKAAQRTRRWAGSVIPRKAPDLGER